MKTYLKHTTLLVTKNTNMIMNMFVHSNRGKCRIVRLTKGTTVTCPLLARLFENYETVTINYLNN